MKLARFLGVMMAIGWWVIWAGTSVAQSSLCSSPGLNVLAATQTQRTVTIQFSVCDSNGVPLSGYTQNAVRLNEDGRPVANVAFQALTADQTNPALTAPLANGNAVALSAIPASIGIVFDATQLLNGTGSNLGDHIGAGRIAIESFLLESGDPPPPRTIVPANPERVAVFIPADQPGQSLRPNDLPDFTADRYLVINTLRVGLPVRQGKTNLFAAVQAAIEATARDARQRGAPALVLVVSDGGDALTGDAFNSLVSQATQQNVRILTFGVGTDRALQNNGFRLQQLAESTGGRYWQRPNEADASAAFAQFVTANPASIYTVRYETAIIDDGQPHQATLEVATPAGNLTYTMPISVTGSGNSELLPVWDVLLRQYFLLAVPVLILVSAIVVLMMAVFRGGINSATQAPTKR